MSGAGFLTLDTVILRPPLGAIAGVLIAAGLWQGGDQLARRLFGARADGLDRAACFIAVVAGTAALSHLVACTGWQMQTMLRVLANLLAVAGLFGLWRCLILLRATWVARDAFVPRWSSLSVSDVGGILACLTALALAVSALAPATDGDSMAIHIGVPLDWLRAGHVTGPPDWLTARLIGLGECLNLLGLAAGSEQLGAILQAAGMGVAYGGLSSVARCRDEQILAALLLMACPVLVFLIPNQKPMFLAVAAIAVMFALLARSRSEFDLLRIALAAVCGAFAVACKVSFLFVAFVGFAGALVIAHRHRAIGRLIVVGAVAFAALPLPGWLRFYHFYGDPLSPFFEFLKSAPDPRVMRLSSYVYEVAGDHTLSGYLSFLWHLAIPRSLGEAATVLGVGAWSTILLVRARGTAAWFAVCAASIALLEAVFGQLAPRFFLDGYLVAAMALVASVEPWQRRILVAALTLQGLMTLAMAGFAAWSLAPGALTPAWREAVTNRAAEGAAEGRWLARVLPADAVITGSFHARAMLPRPFVEVDMLSEDDDMVSLEEQWRSRIARLRAAGINTIVLEPEAYPQSLKLLPKWADLTAGPQTFVNAVRNPFNLGSHYQLQVWRLRPI